MEETQILKNIIYLIDERCKELVGKFTEEYQLSAYDYMPVFEFIHFLQDETDFLSIVNKYLKKILEFLEAFERGAEESALL